MLTGQFGDSKISNNILVTGASGFVGSALYRRFLRDGRNVFGLARCPNGEDANFIKGDILSVGETDLRPCQPDVVIHCAGITISPENAAYDKNSQLHAVNVEGALNIARQASLLKCRRFIFLSSVKVNGEASAPGQPFTRHHSPAPLDPYGISKWEAEKQLLDFTSQKGMELVIIRSPLIYGPQVKGNFAALAKLVDLGVPLPFGAIKNQRSMIFIENLMDLLERCLDEPAAAGQTFLVSDAEDMSTADIVRAIAMAKNKKCFLWPVLPRLIDRFGKLVKREAQLGRITGSLQIDPSHAMRVLEWTPRFKAREGIRLSFK